MITRYVQKEFKITVFKKRQIRELIKVVSMKIGYFEVFITGWGSLGAYLVYYFWYIFGVFTPHLLGYPLHKTLRRSLSRWHITIAAMTLCSSTSQFSSKFSNLLSTFRVTPRDKIKIKIFRPVAYRANSTTNIFSCLFIWIFTVYFIWILFTHLFLNLMYRRLDNHTLQSIACYYYIPM